MKNSVHKKIYLIGAGPGDPELLTIKALNAIKKSGAILYDRLVSKKVLSLAPKDTELIFVGKEQGRHIYSQDEICKLIIKLASKYPYVSRLKGGDPFIFGRGGEEYEEITSIGLACEVIPGITAAAGAAAALGFPLTHRNYSSEVVLLTGHRKTETQKNINYPDFSKIKLKNKTHIIYMGVSRLEKIIEKIMSNNPEMEEFPVLLVENATCSNQRVISGNLNNIVSRAKKNNVKPPCVIIIGEVIQSIQKSLPEMLKK